MAAVLCFNDGPTTASIENVSRIAGTTVERGIKPAKVCACVQERLSSCPYSCYFNRVSWCFARGTLKLEGCVPSFYMKQILQTMLRDLEHVERIANEVDVVSSTGLSSERSAGPHW